VYRDGCSLCDTAWHEWTTFREAHPEKTRDIRVEMLDIGSDVELEKRYGTLIPVFLADGEHLSHYFFDEAEVVRVLSRYELS
jgi:hypothetical protein